MKKIRKQKKVTLWIKGDLRVCAPSEPGPSKCYDGYKEDNSYDGYDDVHLRSCLPGEVAVGRVEN